MKQLQQHKQMLSQLTGLIEEELGCMLQICPENEALARDMRTILEKSSDSFVVLVMGMYSSGKSSLINALLGESLLPSGFLPVTAVLCQLEYSERKELIVYQKADAYGEVPPIVLTNPDRQTLSRYASIDNELGLNCKRFGSERIDSGYQRLVIRWPLDILKDGVVLVDSPGLNDPYNNDYITRSYLPAADAVIYVMNALTGYSEEDRKQLLALNEKGMRNIVFAYTYFDQLQKSGLEETARTRELLCGSALPHSELGREGIHFLSSIQGMVAKQTANAERYASSGYEEFETYLGEYLLAHKGRDQVKALCGRIELYANQLKQTINTLNDAAGTDTELLQKRIAEADAQLSQITMQASNTVSSLRSALTQRRDDLREWIEGQLLGIPDQVSLSDYVPKARLPKGFNRLNPIHVKDKAREFNDECTKEFCDRVSLLVNQWIGSELSAELLRIEQETLKDTLKDIQRITEALEDVTLTITGGRRGTGAAQAIGNTALGIALGLLTGSPYYGAMSTMFGFGAAIKGLSTYAGLTIAAELAKYYFSIVISGGALFLLSTLADILFIVGADERRQESRILKAVEKNGRDMFRKDKALLRENTEQLMALVDRQMDQLCAQLQKALDEDIRQKKELLVAVAEAACHGVEEKQAAIARRNAQRELLEQLTAQMRDIRSRYGLPADI